MIELSPFYTLLSLVILTGHQTSVHIQSLTLIKCLHVCVNVIRSNPIILSVRKYGTWKKKGTGI